MHTTTTNTTPLGEQVAALLASHDRRDGIDRRASVRPSTGRRAIDRMSATPAEIDRLARTLRAERSADQ